jgi:hypothetical protein
LGFTGLIWMKILVLRESCLASDPMKARSHLKNGYKHENKKKADLIIKGMEGAIAAKTVTYDFARLMNNPTEVKCSEFGDAIIKHMD